jgi:hypothetical protein
MRTLGYSGKQRKKGRRIKKKKVSAALDAMRRDDLPPRPTTPKRRSRGAILRV